MNNVKSQIINLGTDQQKTIKEVAEYIIHKTNSNSKIIFVPRKEVFGDYDEIMIRFANIEKAKKLLNYKIKHKTMEVIDNMISEFNNPDSEFYIH
jgi:UDP-glucose 4-epimerase